ncbi:MAG TPA: lysophospholipid acyltransferase family protein [Usitatibacter sp.]|nr:lysophospholipid acyltransferase family protein [Usitatibacter sp.]
MIKAAWDYAILALGVALLAIETFAWGLVALVLWLLLPARVGRRWGRLGAMWGFRIYLGAMEALGAWRLDLTALDELRDAGPLILAPNHPCLLDAVLVVSRLPNAVCVMKGALLGNFLLGPAARLARYVRNDSLLRLTARAGDELRLGGQLLLFPEGTRSTGHPVGPLTDAVGALSRRSRVPVQVLLIETPSRFLGKGWSIASRPQLPLTYRVRLGRRFDPPHDVRAFTAELERQFRRELAAGSQAGARAEDASDAIEGASRSRG